MLKRMLTVVSGHRISTEAGWLLRQSNSDWLCEHFAAVLL